MKRSREPEDDQAIADSDEDEESDNHIKGPDVDSPPLKIVDLEPSQENIDATAMTCLLHRTKLTFSSYQEYESHYNKEHVNRCLECRKNFPSAHLLALHIEECHDAFAAAKRERGEHTYSCFVESCERKCATPEKRRLHTIDKHLYPRNFFFEVSRFGIDGRSSLLLDGRGPHRRRKSSVSIKKEARRKSTGAEAQGVAMEVDSGVLGEKPTPSKSHKPAKAVAVDEPTETRDVDMDDLSGAMSALRFVPPSVKFGRGGRAGFARRQ